MRAIGRSQNLGILTATTKPRRDRVFCGKALLDISTPIKRVTEERATNCERQDGRCLASGSANSESPW